MKPTKHNFGGYETLLVERKNAEHHVVMLHGFGATYEDLLPLAEYMALKPDYNWWFVNGPHNRIFPGMDGRAWFHLDYEVLQRNIQAQNWTGLQTAYGPLVEHAAADLEKFFIATGLPLSKTVLGGFSQGSMMATQYMLAAGEDAKALLIYSGTFANPNWHKMMSKRKSVPVFQSHGVYDPILPIDPARLLATAFRDAKYEKFDFATFGGGHELPAAVLESSAKFVNELN